MKIYLWNPSYDSLSPSEKRTAEFQRTRSLLHFIIGDGKKVLTTETGKPYVEGGPNFSLTHSGNLIGISVADEPNGIDIENSSKKRNFSKLLKKISHPSEQIDFEDFYKLWVLKESYLKKTGEGIGSGRLREICFDINSNPWTPKGILQSETFYSFQFKNFDGAFCISASPTDSLPEVLEVSLMGGEFKTRKLNLALKIHRPENH